jgi:hypothetical protein
MGEKKSFSLKRLFARDKRFKPDIHPGKPTTENSEKDISQSTASFVPTDILTREASADIDPNIPFGPQLLWDEAYDALGDKDPGLLKAYQTVLTRELNETSDDEKKNPQTNEIKNDDLETRRSQMEQLIQSGLKRIEKEAKLKQSIGGVTSIVSDAINVISLAVQACPQAALALTGVTLAIQVGLTFD